MIFKISFIYNVHQYYVHSLQKIVLASQSKNKKLKCCALIRRENEQGRKWEGGHNTIAFNGMYFKKKLKKHPFKIEQELKIYHSELGLYKLK